MRKIKNDRIQNSLIFAPMEGLTDKNFREVAATLYPEWDYFSTEFLRLPSVGVLKERHIIDHIGLEIYKNREFIEKTIFQILCSAKKSSNLKSNIKVISDISIHWLDLNIGCPSKRVNSHYGGAYFLADLKALQKTVNIIRSNFNGTFSVKMRVGISDDSHFIPILNILKNEGVDLITVHARTRDQAYKGNANWRWIEDATSSISIPIIGNGDVNTVSQIDEMFKMNCSSVMIGRGALKSPWLASMYKKQSEQNVQIDRSKRVVKFFHFIINKLKVAGVSNEMILKRVKAYAFYMMREDKEILKSKNLNQFTKGVT